MGPFIGRRGDWRMVEDSGIVEKLREVNGGQRPAYALYLYGDPAYCTVYGIMGPYKNYPSRSRIAVQNKFNKAMSRLRIEVEYGFAIHQNLWTWNDFHLGLKVRQRAAIGYVVLVLLSNIWTCMRGNQTSYQFGSVPPSVEDYLQLNFENTTDTIITSSESDEDSDEITSNEDS